MITYKTIICSNFVGFKPYHDLAAINLSRLGGDVHVLTSGNNWFKLL